MDIDDFWDIILYFSNQLNNASVVVEYVSWLTASIFSVMGILTVFIIFQYQNFTTELQKITWRYKEIINKGIPNINEIAEQIDEFQYFSQKSSVVKDASHLVSILLNTLILLWVICGLAMLLKYSIVDGKFQLISIVLVLITTLLFVSLSIGLLKMLRKITDPTGGLNFKKSDDLRDVTLLQDKEYDIENLFLMEFNEIHLIINNFEPYLIVNFLRNIRYFKYQLLISLESEDVKVYFGTNIDQINGKRVDFNISRSDQESLNRLLELTEMELFEVHVTILINNEIISYNAEINSSEVDDYPKYYKFRVLTTEKWTPPNQIVHYFKDNNFGTVIDSVN